MKGTGIDEIMKPEQIREWLSEFRRSEAPVREIEPLWAILRQSGDKSRSEDAFAQYEAEIRRAFPDTNSMEVSPEQSQFDRFWMRFDRLLLWTFGDRQFFLGVESSDHDICIRAGAQPLK